MSEIYTADVAQQTQKTNLWNWNWNEKFYFSANENVQSVRIEKRQFYGLFSKFSCYCLTNGF